MRSSLLSDVRNEVRAELELAQRISTLDVDRVVHRLAGRVADLVDSDLNEHPYAHLDTAELELALEGLDLLLAGDEPDESSTEATLHGGLWDELDRRGELSAGGNVRPSGWPHKALLILERDELDVLTRVAGGGKLATEAEVRLLVRVADTLVDESERVDLGLEEGFSRDLEEARRESHWHRHRDARARARRAADQ